MSRAVILPTPADPYLLNYWFNNFDRWSKHVDALYLSINSPLETVMIDYIKKIAEERPKVKVFYKNQQTDHGVAINDVLDSVVEDYVMLIEDDALIISPSYIDEQFRDLEDNKFDVIGSKRGSCSFEILERAKQVWDVSFQGDGDQGCNFWPNFFFTKTDILRGTDRNFCAKQWGRGGVIEALGDYVVVGEGGVVGDTFVNTSLQLRAKNYRIKIVPQYHASPEDLDHFYFKTLVFDGVCPWFHIGSLSSGISGVLTDGKGRCLARRLLDPEKENDILPMYANTDAERREWSRRVQWWKTYHEFAETNKGDEEFYRLYGEGVQRIINQYGLSISEINRRQKVYSFFELV